MSDEASNGAAVGSTELLAEIITLRDEARSAQINLIPAFDPTGDARMAYGVVADRLDKIIARANALHQPERTE